MLFLYDNLHWMLFNVMLALVPMILVWILRKKLHPVLHIIFLIFWFIFLPNTVYLVTDIEYLPYQIYRTTVFEQALLFIEYGILMAFGVYSYLYSLEPLEKILAKMRLKNKKIVFILIHLLVAFGVVMGKVQRTHSWYVITEPQRVVRDAIATLSASDLIFWVFFCALVINGFYFAFKKYFSAFTSRKKRRK